MGCGSLGSSLAYLLMLRSIDDYISELFLIDNDILEYKNLPYLNMNIYSNPDYIMKPKSVVLKTIICGINPKVILKTRFGNEKIDFDIDYYVIDCRDTSSEFIRSNMKINMDGYFGIINLNPQDKLEKTNSRYSIKNSKFYAHALSNLCINIIFGEVNLYPSKYSIDLKRGTIISLRRDNE